MGGKLETHDLNFCHKKFLEVHRKCPLSLLRTSLGKHSFLQARTGFSVAHFVLILLQVLEHWTRFRNILVNSNYPCMSWGVSLFLRFLCKNHLYFIYFFALSIFCWKKFISPHYTFHQYLRTHWSSLLQGEEKD